MSKYDNLCFIFIRTRGRPPKINKNIPYTGRKRGRPRVESNLSSADEGKNSSTNENKRSRGRPRKTLENPYFAKYDIKRVTEEYNKNKRLMAVHFQILEL